MNDDKTYSLYDFCESMSNLLGLPAPVIDDFGYTLHKVSRIAMNDFGKPDCFFMSTATMEAFRKTFGEEVIIRADGQTDEELRQDIKAQLVVKV